VSEALFCFQCRGVCIYSRTSALISIVPTRHLSLSDGRQVPFGLQSNMGWTQLRSCLPVTSRSQQQQHTYSSLVPRRVRSINQARFSEPSIHAQKRPLGLQAGQTAL
jgi:hypothetical protein